MYNALYKSPVIGCISGAICSICMAITNALRDELILKEVSGLGVWAGSLVACLSLVIYLFKVYDIIVARYRAWRKPPAALILVIITAAALCAGCGARRSAVKTEYHQVSSDSSGKQRVDVSKITTGDKQETKAVKVRDSVASTITSSDTGSRTSQTHTTIRATFPAGAGPTPAEVAAAAGNKRKTGRLLNGASSIEITTDGTTQVKKGKTVQSTGKRITDSLANTFITDHSELKLDSSATAQAKVEKKTTDESKDKSTSRAGTSWVIPVVAALVLLAVGWYIEKRTK